VEIEARTKAICKIDIDSGEAVRILCDVLHMDFVLDEDTDYFVLDNGCGEKAVYIARNGHDECVDDRGNLFVALRNVAVNLFPNSLFVALIIFGNKEVCPLK